MRNYITGFIFSILLTLTAYFIVTEKLLSGSVLVFAILALAFIQLWIQMIFFLHIDQEEGPRWNLAIFLSSFAMILILIVGSLWIMRNLNYNHSSDVEADILNEEGIHK